MNTTTLYALDFDGVICDSAIETGMTGWLAARQIWPDMPDTISQENLAQFRHVRPMIETGYEAILAMRLLFQGYTPENLLADYQDLTAKLLAEPGVSVESLKTLFGATRDAWIKRDLESWIANNPLFENIASRLQALGTHSDWIIITTKQERFVSQILAAYGIEISPEAIFGLDRNMSKVAILKQFRQRNPQQKIVFVEDRLPTLVNVAKQPELAEVELQFALWGYNTDQDKRDAENQGLSCVSLLSFLDF